ncbi:hypothetical protein P171DRAFT_426294 [Karstenula rhodostoma CBS 690.94]|uniref:Circumsporozoite protein n=1 Tax=Karstenula rhodostoma CBS 690.94 TaxID=1392251 RepID=A0A9P4UK00_9PLEO|nr:hypothetical protein P171DRAFT_426294 [Karstenula rhodostoma CBS 690.94]
MVSKVILLSAIVAYVEARFGQEQVPISAISAVQGGDPGAASTIAGGAISDLLGAANSCAKLATADKIVSELGGGADAIAAAIGMVTAEKNTNPFANGNVQNVCGDASLPATPELRGITPLIDPDVDTAGGVAALSQSSAASPLDATGKSVFDLLSEAGFGDLVVSQDAAGGAAAGGNANAGQQNNGGQDQGNANAGNDANNDDANAGDNANNGNANAGNHANNGNANAGNDANNDNANAGNNANNATADAGNNANNATADAGADNSGAACDAGNANQGANNGNATQNAGNQDQDAGNANQNAGNANQNAGNAQGGAAAGSVLTGAEDFGLCTPTISFELGRAGRKPDEGTFQIADATAVGGQQDALNPNIITNALCNQLTNVCEANDAAVSACESAKQLVADAGTRDQTTADLFNSALGFGGAARKRTITRRFRA